MSHITEVLHEKTLEALVQASKDPAVGLEGAAEEEIKSRLKAIEQGAAGLLVIIASDGLTLGNKQALEKGIVHHLNEVLLEDIKYSIYFRKFSTDPVKGPVPVNKKTTPFGVNYNKRAIPGVKEVILVASGKGGVGKSTVSTNLAVTLAKQGHSVGLLDADIYGPSTPMMLGVSGPMRVANGEKLIPNENYGVKVVSFGFIADTREPVIWRGPMVAKALDQLCHRTQWGEIDFLIVDLPPGTGDVQMTLIEGLPLSGAIIVTTPQNVALLDAHKALSMFETLGVPVLGVVENMSSFHCPECGHESFIFGQGGGESFAETRKVPLLGRIPLESRIRQLGDSGAPASLSDEGSVKEAFESLATIVSKQGADLH